MHFSFPYITNIHDILPSIENTEEFKVIKKEHYQVINYNFQHTDTFNQPDTKYLDPIRCECRGLIFDNHGRLIRRAYHKFFNANEKPSTNLLDIDWTQPYVVLEKLDGSMITPMRVENHIRLTTKLGVTDVSLEAEAWAAGRDNYNSFIDLMMTHRCIPIFEWTSRSNRVVLDYKQDNLVLTAIRGLYDGQYYSYKDMVEMANAYSIPSVKPLYDGVGDVNSFVEELKERDDIEGVVIRFNNGHMIKMKTDWYVLLHRTKDQIYKESNIIRLILDDKLDDLMPILMTEDAKRLEEYRDKFLENYGEFLETHDILLRNWIKKYTRKDFALQVAPALPDIVKTVSFNSWDNPEKFRENVDRILRQQLERNKPVDNLRPLWLNSVVWSMDARED